MPIVISKPFIPTYQDIILATASASPLGYWTLDTEAGFNLTDLSTNGFDLTRAAATPHVAGKVNEGVDFTATFSDEATGGPFSYGSNLSSDWSMESWVNIVEVVPADVAILRAFDLVGGQTGIVQLRLVRNTSTTPTDDYGIQVITSLGGGSTQTINNIAAVNTWNHIAVSNDITLGVTIYLNGAIVSSPTGAMGTNSNMVETTVEIGGQNNLNTVDGIMDEVVLYSGVISPADVTAHYDAGLAA